MGAGLETVDHRIVGFAVIPFDVVSEARTGAGQLDVERGKHVTYGVAHKFAGGTKEQYEASIAAVHPEGGGLPVRQLHHAAGPSADGWTICAVHDSRAGWEKFRDGILMPRTAAGIADGFAAPPEETGFEIDNEVRTSAHQRIHHQAGPVWPTRPACGRIAGGRPRRRFRLANQ